MIEILIITDNISDWVDKIIGHSCDRKFNNKTFFINTLWLHVAITSDISDGNIVQRWNTIVLDKDISEEIYQKILLPSLSPIIDLRNYEIMTEEI